MGGGSQLSRVLLLGSLEWSIKPSFIVMCVTMYAIISVPQGYAGSDLAEGGMVNWTERLTNLCFQGVLDDN